MCTLTYPGDWAAFCPADVVLNRHIAEIVALWRAKWGEPVGLFGKEFQDRGAPHVNLVCGLA